MCRTVIAAVGSEMLLALMITPISEEISISRERLARWSSTFDLGGTLRGHRHDSVLSTELAAR